MSSFFADVNARMFRSVQQENRSLSTSLTSSSASKKGKKYFLRNRCCLFLIMLSPLVLVLTFLYVLSWIRSMEQYEQEQQQQQQTGNSQNLLSPGVIKAVIHEMPQLEQQQQEKKLRKREQRHHEQQLLQPQQQKEQIESDNNNDIDTSSNETLILATKHGNIRIVLRPDLSTGSVAYIHRLVKSKVCRRCNFYRAEKPGILQGVLANKDVGFNTEKGPCPHEFASIPNSDCPIWDTNCGCHGPLMTRGMVAWAGGSAGGPDFFIDNYKHPADWWGTQHTNFGHIQDEESLQVIDNIFELPVEKRGDMTYLQEVIPFDMHLE